MTYIDGFVMAVPTNNKQKFIDHAKAGADYFKEFGALEIRECWGDDVQEGKVTSFPMAVKRNDDETVVLSWIIWPSKDMRDECYQKMMKDEKFNLEKNPMPFDGKRMIYGGFTPVVEA